jgi:hypothetical protein
MNVVRVTQPHSLSLDGRQLNERALSRRSASYDSLSREVQHSGVVSRLKHPHRSRQEAIRSKRGAVGKFSQRLSQIEKRVANYRQLR